MYSSVNLVKNIKIQSNLLCSLKVLYGSSAKCSTNTYGSIYKYDKDPGPAFLNPETQDLLKSMTRLQFDKVFRKRNVPKNAVNYKFMTTEQVEDEIKNAALKAEKMLLMPPIVKMKVEDEHKIISKDPALSMLSESTFVFTDITFGLKDSERTIVIRHPDGMLEKAPQSVRKRINQIYFPLPGRRIRTPKMFEEKYLKSVLEEQKYEFLLDRLCVQYEPYEEKYHEISSQVYQHINENKAFDVLRSTRHFGPMCFFFAWHKIVDDLLLDMIKRDFLRNGAQLISLMYSLSSIEDSTNVLKRLSEFPESKNIIKEQAPVFKTEDVHEEISKTIGKTANDLKVDEICIEFIEKFTKEHGLKKVQLELALQAFKEIHERKKHLAEGLNKAHGVNQ